MKSFYDLEQYCSLTFESVAPLWHVWTPENHEIFFTDTESFRAGMNILAIAAKLSPGIKIITFELMTNHLHLTIAGERAKVEAFLSILKKYLSAFLRSCGKAQLGRDFAFKSRELDSLDNVRNVIVYNNRNGYVVNPAWTPFSYPWGANAYYFNPTAKKRFTDAEVVRLTQRERRHFIRSHDSDGMADSPRLLDGFACPLDFCDVNTGEKLFRNASHYFREVSRNIESQKTVAAEIGERYFYNDDDLFAAVRQISKEKYGQLRPALLPPEAKTELARRMHYEYYAGNKQIARILKADIDVINSLFPTD